MSRKLKGRPLRFLKIIMAFGAALLMAACSSSSVSNTNAHVSITFSGDVALTNGLGEKELNSITGSSLAKQSEKADFNVINFESATAQNATLLKKRFSFNTDPHLLPRFHELGITHFLLGNNHSYDAGLDGLQESMKNIKSSGFEFTGAGENLQEACSPSVLEKGDVKVFVFSYVELMLEAWTQRTHTTCLCNASIITLMENILQTRMENPEAILVVNLHWGTEYARFPNPSQSALAKSLIHNGADAIIGHHPHVVQTIEVYQGKPIFYSIGNFLFPSQRSDIDGAITVKLNINEAGEKTYEIWPLAFENNVPHLAKGKEKASLGTYLFKSSKGAVNLSETVLGWELDVKHTD